MNKEKRYLLAPFQLEELEYFKNEIDERGCFLVKTDTDTVKIYTAELAFFLTSDVLEARNTQTKVIEKINGLEYLKTYLEAYKQGEQYFETEFKVSPNTLYGSNAEQYVGDIHSYFFHAQHFEGFNGWGFVKKHYPKTISYREIKVFGYYSGIVNKVEEQVKKHPRLFAKFDKCEHNLPPQQTETNTVQETPTFTNNFDKITPTEIYKHFKAGLVEKQYLTEQELNEYLKAAFELKTIPETLFKIKDAPKKAAIEAVFYEYYKNVAGKIHGKQNQYAALLGDYFEGYKTTTVSSNFSKSVY